MAKLRRIGRTYYSDLYIKGQGRVRKKLDTDRRIAEQKLAALVQQQDDGRYGVAARGISWPDFKAKFLAFSSGNKAEGTYRKDQAALRSLEEFVTLVKLADITPELLEQWVAHRRKKGDGVPTMNRDLRAVKAMMRKAEGWGYIQPQRWGIVKRLREARGRLLFYSVQEMRRLLPLCKDYWKTIALLGARAGLRRSEIYWLSWQDVELDRNRLHICPKDGWNPKDYEQRWIKLHKDLAKHLKKLPREGRWVLGEPRPTLGSMTNYFKRILRKAGLKGSIHTLRHTFASHLAMAGVSMKLIAAALGHASTQTTEIYAHLSPESIDAVIERLPEF